MGKNNISIFLLVLLGTVVLSGCGFGKKRDSKSSKVEKTISSEDSLFSITIPRGWRQLKTNELNDNADIQAKNWLEERFLMVLTEPKEELDFSYDEWRELIIDDYLSTFDSYTVLDTADVVIESRPAKQYVINCVFEGEKATLLATYIDGETYFAQVVTWTTRSKYESSVEEFKKISNSIKGL